jgi:hypothetical protein
MIGVPIYRIDGLNNRLERIDAYAVGVSGAMDYGDSILESYISETGSILENYIAETSGALISADSILEDYIAETSGALISADSILENYIAETSGALISADSILENYIAETSGDLQSQIDLLTPPTLGGEVSALDSTTVSATVYFNIENPSSAITTAQSAIAKISVTAGDAAYVVKFGFSVLGNEVGSGAPTLFTLTAAQTKTVYLFLPIGKYMLYVNRNAGSGTAAAYTVKYKLADMKFAYA